MLRKAWQEISGYALPPEACLINFYDPTARLVLDLFFQAEDGIRDIGVTGVQTCALPISSELYEDGKATGKWFALNYAEYNELKTLQELEKKTGGVSGDDFTTSDIVDTIAFE